MIMATALGTTFVVLGTAMVIYGIIQLLRSYKKN